MKTYGMVAALFCLTSAAGAEVKSRVVDYKQGDTPLQGLLAWDDAAKGKKPGILVVHEWWGNNEHARNQALRLAKAGYVAFALDMYGKGKVTTHPKDAQAFAAEATKDPKTVDARFNAALEILKASPQVDASKIGAIGYCFGGGVVPHRGPEGRRPPGGGDIPRSAQDGQSGQTRNRQASHPGDDR